MSYAKTILAKKLLKNKGLNPSWLSSEKTLSKELKTWIIDTLTKDDDMTEFSNSKNPYLILLILNCCQNNYSSRNVDKLLSSTDCQQTISAIVRKHFPGNHSYYQGNEIADPETLCAAASTILFFDLDRKQGFKNEWTTYDVSRVMGTFHIWIKHRLHDHMKLNKDDKTIPMGDTQGINDCDKRGNHEDVAQVKSTVQDLSQGIDDVMISESEDQIKQILNEFVLSLPIIATTQATSLIDKGDDSWNLFMKLNALNLLQWLMSNPLYCDNVYAFDFLSQSADIPLQTVLSWKKNLPNLISELNSSENSQGTKAKEYTLLAFDPNISTIEEIRGLPDINKQRETLRRRNNNTHAGVYTLCLLACLTIKGSNPIGVKLLESLLGFYHDLALKIVPDGRWLLTKELVTFWANSDASIANVKEDLLNVIALVRYESSFEALSDTKRANVFKIHRILKSIGHQIASTPSVPLEIR
ncbi:MAG: hypothetical protein CL916_06550 [Deltaproteobacteria bacterium]|nr:hypothetical protein [Deltaproteobacteria bacterium]